MPGRITAATRILQIKIELRGERPIVWRRVLVPDSMTLAELHEVVQLSMGWANADLHEFEIEAQRFGVTGGADDPDEDLLDGARAALGLVAGVGSELIHLHELDDACWSHLLRVEVSTAPEPGLRYPRCVAGARGPATFEPHQADKRLESLAWINGA